MMDVEVTPAVLLCSLCLAWGVYLLVTSQPLGRPKQDLEAQLNRLERQARTVVTVAGAQPVFGSRLLGYMLHDLGHALHRLLSRLGVGGGLDLERKLALVKPEVSVGSYYGQAFISGLVGGAVFPFMNYLGLHPPGMGSWPVLTWLMGLVIGFGYPNVEVTRALKRRHTAMLMELPVVLDLVALSVSAGLSAEQALLEVARESEGLVAAELRRATAEMGLTQAGYSLPRALEAMAERNALPELTVFVTQLRSALDEGLELGETLAVQAEGLRERKRLRIIEHGGKAGVKMVIPVALILPVLFVVLLLPALLELLQLGW